MADRQKRTVRHALFEYEKGTRIAFRGQEVELLPEDVERGERGDDPAVTAGSLDPVGTLSAFPEDEAEQDRWLKEATVEEVLQEARRNPESADGILAAEERRGKDARKTLLTALTAK